MKKWPYLGNGLTDQQEIWHDGAHWPSEPYWQLKFLRLKIQDDAGRNRKQYYLIRSIVLQEDCFMKLAQQTRKHVLRTWFSDAV